jgi:hypothetical protein
MSERRIVIEEPCEFETGVEHEGCGYLAHRFCNKCGWVQDEHQCTSRTVISEIPDEWVDRAARAEHDFIVASVSHPSAMVKWGEDESADDEARACAKAGLTAALFGGVVSKEEER